MFDSDRTNIFSPSISDDGNTVAFFASSDSETLADVFIVDVISTEVISISIGSTSWGGSKIDLSADGRFIVIAATTGSVREGLFIFDRQSDTLETVISTDTSTDNSPGESYGALLTALSADGQTITFVTAQNGIVEDDQNDQPDVYVYDIDTRIFERISPEGPSGYIIGVGEPEVSLDISADGRYIVFNSAGNIPVEEDIPSCIHWLSDNSLSNCHQVYLYDRQTNSYELISQSSLGIPGNQVSLGGSISADGRFVIFESYATNLTNKPIGPCVDMGGDYCIQVYLRDRQTQQTYLVTEGWQGEPPNAKAYDATISANGQYATYITTSSTLIPGIELSDQWYIFRTDLAKLIEKSSSQ